MLSSDIRHVIHLHLHVIGSSPPIWREIVVDDDASLAVVHQAIRATFRGHDCGHYLFTDADPEAAALRQWSPRYTRWGDVRTMVDLRDPTVVDDASVRVGPLFSGGRRLYFEHTCAHGLIIEITACGDDLVAASAPAVRVVAGKNEAPLPCARLAFEHTALTAVLDDATHPAHAVLRDYFDRVSGPWGSFDPQSFDVAAAQRTVDRALDGAAVGNATDAARVAHALPHAARPGFERHLDEIGIDMPSVITADDARQLTRAFGWLLERASDTGIALVDGMIEPTLLAEGIAAIGSGFDEGRMLRLIALAKRYRLVYQRTGVLRAPRRVGSFVSSPSALCVFLAAQLSHGRMAPWRSADAQALFLLAIADGSLADPTVGTRAACEALWLIRAVHASRESRPYWWGEECEQACECPRGEGGSWHDLIARVIRDAGTRDADDGAPGLSGSAPGRGPDGTSGLASGGGWGTSSDASGASSVASNEPDLARSLRFPAEWFSDRANPWDDDMPTRPPRSAWSRWAEPVSEKELLDGLEDTLDVLSLLGLERREDGTWHVPDILREFARACLRAA